MFLTHLKRLMPNRFFRLHALIHGSGIEAATVGLLTAQVPGDRFIIGAIQINMIIEIASEFGVSIKKSAALAIFESQIATMIGLEIVTQGGKYFPVWGNLLNGSTAISITEMIGWATVEYYEKEE